MKKTLMALAASSLLAAPALAEDVKLGIILGFTGPIESLTPDMAAGAELAIAEVNAGGNFMGGHTISSVRGDSTCIDAAAASTAAERLIWLIKSVASWARLFRRHHCYPAECCYGKRRCNGFTISFTSPFNTRRQ